MINLQKKNDLDILLSDAKEAGYKEIPGLGTRIASGSNWEIWIEPLNYVLTDAGKRSPRYYSSFGALLNTLKENKIKFWLSQEKWNNLVACLEQTRIEMNEALDKVVKSLKYLNSKYNVEPTD